MVGFTTAAAMIIGLSQIKNVFGFGSEVPNIGAHNGVEYNWEQMRWYYNNWNDYVNPQAARIAFGVYVPLFAIWVVRKYFPTTPQRKQSVLFRFWDFFSVCATLFAIIFAAMATRNLVREHGDLPDVKRLDFVGAVPSGLNILRVPHFRWPLRQFILDLLPLTIVAYMESYAVARKTGQKYGFLSLLNASQELVALGVGNILGCLASGYPVAGSFSRSALNATTGAVSPLSKAITSVVVCLALGTLTGTFYWIPNAALGGVVWIAILNLLDPLEFWKAWMFSKKDFFVMFATFMFTFLCSSEIGLGIGLGMSIVILLRDLAFGLHGRPVSKQLEHEGVDVIRLNSNLVFVSATRIKDTLLLELFMKYRSDNNPLKAVVIDFVDVKYVDLSGLLAMYDIMVEAKEKGIVFVTANVAPDVQAIMDKMGIVNDTITDLKLYHHVTTAAAMIGTAGETDKRLEMECLASVTCILSEDEPHSGANEELKHLV
jgi:MFS superfamily sulfate permease-like transporter